MKTSRWKSWGRPNWPQDRTAVFSEHPATGSPEPFPSGSGNISEMAQSTAEGPCDGAQGGSETNGAFTIS